MVPRPAEGSDISGGYYLDRPWHLSGVGGQRHHENCALGSNSAPRMNRRQLCGRLGPCRRPWSPSLKGSPSIRGCSFCPGSSRVLANPSEAAFPSAPSRKGPRLTRFTTYPVAVRDHESVIVSGHRAPFHAPAGTSRYGTKMAASRENYEVDEQGCQLGLAHLQAFSPCPDLQP